MRNKTIIRVLLLVTCLLAGCVEPLTPVEPTTEKADLVIKISSLDAILETKGVENGDTFNRLLVLVTRRDGDTYQVMHRKDTLITAVPGTTEPLIEVSSAEVPFKEVEVGSYEVFAYANYDETAWQDPAQTIAGNEGDETQAFNPDRLMKELVSRDVPETPGTGTHMLLTGHAVIPVGVANNIGSVKLYRPVARLKVWLNNHTPYPIYLDDIQFNAFNVSKSYLIGRTDEEGLPAMPDGSEYRLFSTYVPLSPILKNERKEVFSSLLYEMQMPEGDTCRIYAKLRMVRANENPSEIELAMGETWKGVAIVPRADILSMNDGDSKTVMLVNPKSNGQGRIFGYNGSSVVSAGPPSSSYSTLAQFSGFLSSYITSDIYLLTLKKENGQYQLIGKNGFDIFASVGVNEGLAGPDSPSWSDLDASFYDYLVRFKSGNQYLYRTNNAGLGKSDYQNGTRADYQWVFFEPENKYKGAVMRLINNQTSQVSYLRFIRRNQELNVELNAYYEIVNGQLRFEVDNTWWLDDASHKSTHSYK